MTRLVITIESSAAEAAYTKFSIGSYSGTAVVPTIGLIKLLLSAPGCASKTFVSESRGDRTSGLMSSFLPMCAEQWRVLLPDTHTTSVTHMVNTVFVGLKHTPTAVIVFVLFLSGSIWFLGRGCVFLQGLFIALRAGWRVCTRVHSGS